MCVCVFLDLMMSFIFCPSSLHHVRFDIFSRRFIFSYDEQFYILSSPHKKEVVVEYLHLDSCIFLTHVHTKHTHLPVSLRQSHIWQLEESFVYGS